MKKMYNFFFVLVMLSSTSILNAQTNVFPTTGNAGVGTITPISTLQVVGTSAFGGKKDLMLVNEAGKLMFKGSANYFIDTGRYVFQNTYNPNYGLFFGQKILRYELRDEHASAIFYVSANKGNGYFAGNLGIGVQKPVTKLDVDGDINISTGSSIKMNGDVVFKAYNTNLFAGVELGVSNTTGYDNTGIGYRTLHNNTTGHLNTALGYKALEANSTGYFNTAIGWLSLNYNTTGGYNTATGNGALEFNTTGTGNAAFGCRALGNNFWGYYNTASGYNALEYIQSGYQNTGVGYSAMYTSIAATNCTAIGNFTRFTNDFSNATILGSNAIGTASNQVRIGDNLVTSIGGYTNWTNVSDGRVKKNIKENVPGLEFINQLKPVTYNLDLDKADEIVQAPVIKDSLLDNTNDEGKSTQEKLKSRNAKMQIVYTGFVAQDVEKVAKSLNYDFSGVDAPKNDKDLYGLRYAEFVVPLVKAVQELSKNDDAKDVKIEALSKQNEDLQKQLNDLKNLVLSMQQSSSNSFSQTPTKLIGLSNASLEQNIPNPFNNVTTIN
ncbi:MAG: tail fiber domain-containing protein, partial [Bacteroidota bacterium]